MHTGIFEFVERKRRRDFQGVPKCVEGSGVVNVVVATIRIRLRLFVVEFYVVVGDVAVIRASVFRSW